MTEPTPQPGDVVRLDGEYDVLVKSGSTGVIDGHSRFDFDDGHGERVLVVFHASAFRGGSRASDPNEYVSCSGGPAPMVPVQELTHVGTIERRFWRWKDYPCAGGGEDYIKTVDLWSWAGKTSAA